MRFHNVQVLRALAAYAVVVHHVLDAFEHYFGRPGPSTHAFSAGVDVFFVISGFIITQSTQGRPIGALHFLRTRWLRVAPIYVLLTLLAYSARLSGFKLFAVEHNTPGELVASLLFLPSFDPMGRVLPPVLFVGWSLNYELFFYVLFALALLLKRRRTLVLCGALVALVGLAPLTDNPYLHYWGRPFVLEFALGIGLWHLSRVFRPSRVVASAVLAAGALMLVPTVWVEQHPLLLAALRGGGALLLVFGAIALEYQGMSLRARALTVQGDASYALYLTHPFVLQALGKLAVAAGITMSTLSQRFGFVAVSLMMAGVAGTVVHLLLERPLGSWIRQRVQQRWSILPSRSTG